MLGQGTQMLTNEISGGRGGAGGEGRGQGTGGGGGVGQGPTVHQHYYITTKHFIVANHQLGYAGSYSLVSDMEQEDAAALLLQSAAQGATIGTEQIATEIVEELHYRPPAIVQNQACLLGKEEAQSHDNYVWTESKKTTGPRGELDLTFIMGGTGERNGVRTRQQFKILLTLTPTHVNARVSHIDAQVSQHPLAWKVFEFKDTIQKVGWNKILGFATVVQDLPDVDSPGFICIVKPSESAVLAQNGALVPSGKLQSGSLAIGVQNKSGVPATLALCSVETVGPGHDQCCPMLELRDLENNVLVELEPPMLLQAYVVSNYQEGQILKPEDQHQCLFLDARGNPQPLDIDQLLSISSPTFRLKAEPSGGVTLDKQASSAFQMQ